MVVVTFPAPACRLIDEIQRLCSVSGVFQTPLAIHKLLQQLLYQFKHKRSSHPLHTGPKILGLVCHFAGKGQGPIREIDFCDAFMAVQ